MPIQLIQPILISSAKDIRGAVATDDRPSPAQRKVNGPSIVLVFGVLLSFLLINVPILGIDAWQFDIDEYEPRGLLAAVARIAGAEWDLGMLRSSAVFGAVAIFVAFAVALGRRSIGRVALVALVMIGAASVLAPAVVQQAALRDATDPWFYTNDATYQAEIAGRLLLHGTNPYGHDYSETDLVRWYSFDGSVAPNAEQIAQLGHFPYYPGTALLGAIWQLVPAPFGDMRFALLAATLALIPASLLLPGPWPVRLAIGVALATNPLSVRMAWFGMLDAPTLLALLLAFACGFRRRWFVAAVLLAAAVLFKQFALAAVPFLALYALQKGGMRALLVASGTFAGALAVVAGPFIAADARAFWIDRP